MIAETKKALTNAGVNVSSLEEYAAGKVEGVKRSNHVLLVKNLPYGSSENELAKMFSKFGSLDKIILPPTKTLALVCIHVFFHSYFILGFVIECASAIENLYSLCQLLVKVYTDALREVSVYD